MTQPAEDRSIKVAQVYFVKGDVPKYLHEQRYAVKDPPVSGFGVVVLMPAGDKRTTILCPYSLDSHQVPNSCAEIRYAKMLPDVDIRKVGETITRNWEQWARMGHSVDFDVAAMALERIGMPVPKIAVAPQIDPETGLPKSRGGKEADPDKAPIPLRRSTKRGAIAEFFIHDEPQSLREAMAKFGMTRSGVLSHLFTIHQVHNLGYRLTGDCATLDIPKGFDPFAGETPRPATETDGPGTPGAGPAPSRGHGKPTDTTRLTSIRQASKRGAIAERFLKRSSIDDAATALGLTRSAVLSHLFTIWKDHGVGYDLDGDGKACLLVPEGYVLWLSPDTPKRSKATQNKPHDERKPETVDDDEWLR